MEWAVPRPPWPSSVFREFSCFASPGGFQPHSYGFMLDFPPEEGVRGGEWGGRALAFPEPSLCSRHLGALLL